MNTKEIDTFPATMHTTDWYFTAISVSIDVDFAYIPMRDFFKMCFNDTTYFTLSIRSLARVGHPNIESY